LDTVPVPTHSATPADRATALASRFSYDELAHIYNACRVDYIVPMPMNARRMEEYVRDYDVALDSSIVTFNGDGETTGIGMLGLRDQRAWFTRLGVIPDRRGHKVGQYLMETLMTHARSSGATRGQLEVIEGNTPAHNLFLKLGFEITRKLLVIRRPPGKLDSAPPPVEPLTPDEIRICLAQRMDTPSWLDETASLLHAGNLTGLRLGDRWIVYRKSAVQLSAFVFSHPDPDLICAVHHQHPLLDTKIENVDVGCWSAFHAAGYVEAFSRLEMLTTL